MSIYNRDYMRDGTNSRGFGAPSSWNVVTWLLAINIAVYLVNLVSRFRLADLLGLSVESLTRFYLWGPVTYQFTHNGVIHFLFNMLILFFIGRTLLGVAGPRQVVRIYLLGGIAGGFLQVLYNLFVGPDGNIIGASGSNLALLASLATITGNQKFRMLLFFFIPVNMSLKTIIYIIIAVDVITLFLPRPPEAEGVAVFAHFGGLLFGWLHTRNGFASRRRPSFETGRKKGFFGIRILKEGEEPSAPPRKKKEAFVTKDVDAILDKINEQGFQSLTREERKALEKSSNRLSKRLDDDR